MDANEARRISVEAVRSGLFDEGLKRILEQVEAVARLGKTEAGYGGSNNFPKNQIERIVRALQKRGFRVEESKHHKDQYSVYW